MKKRLVVYLAVFFAAVFSQLQAQKSSYPISYDGNKAVVTGFVSFEPLSDEHIFANAYFWVLDNVCTVRKDEIKDMDIENKSFKFNVKATSLETSKLKNIYTMEISVKVLSGKLVFYISDVWIEGQNGLIRKTVALNSLKIETKAKDKEIADDFVRSESSILNKMFAFININDMQKISHWSDIANENVVKGMNEDEVRLSVGKPRTIIDSGKEIQWMYNASFYIFFKNGKVDSIMR